MKLLTDIYAYLYNLDEKEFTTLLAATLSTLTLGFFLTIFFYYRKMTTLKKQFTIVNEKREEIQTLLRKYGKIEQQQQAADSLLEEYKNFKIRGYFESLLAELDLTNKKTSELETTKAEQDTKYIETTLTASLGSLTMKQTCQLLEKIKQNRIIYPKELEIITSKKRPRTVDVMITIATLQPSEQPEQVE